MIGAQLSLVTALSLDLIWRQSQETVLQLRKVLVPFILVSRTFFHWNTFFLLTCFRLRSIHTDSSKTRGTRGTLGSSLDRSQSVSSIASVLSSSSTKTVSNSRAVSPFPSVQPVSRLVPHLAPTVPGSSAFPPKTGFSTKLPILEFRSSLAQPAPQAATSTSELRSTKSTGASGSTSRVSLPGMS